MGYPEWIIFFILAVLIAWLIGEFMMFLLDKF
jgi:hypothetical protein